MEATDERIIEIFALANLLRTHYLPKKKAERKKEVKGLLEGTP